MGRKETETLRSGGDSLDACVQELLVGGRCLAGDEVSHRQGGEGSLTSGNQ